MMSSQEDFGIVHRQLLPPGRGWRGALMQALLNGLAGVDARIAQRMRDLLREADPRNADETLDDWESNLGLPDPCVGQLATLQERRQAVVARYTSGGGQSRKYFIALAAAMGYVITIDEFRPFVTGLSRCGDVLNGPATCRFYWRVHVPGLRYTPFRTGQSRCGEKLGSIERAADLECELTRLQPGEATLIFSYDGV
jgi:uncharacterized protein YmfQ (DUF2313 family)